MNTRLCLVVICAFLNCGSAQADIDCVGGDAKLQALVAQMQQGLARPDNQVRGWQRQIISMEVVPKGTQPTHMERLLQGVFTDGPTEYRREVVRLGNGVAEVADFFTNGTSNRQQLPRLPLISRDNLPELSSSLIPGFRLHSQCVETAERLTPEAYNFGARQVICEKYYIETSQEFRSGPERRLVRLKISISESSIIPVTGICAFAFSMAVEVRGEIVTIDTSIRTINFGR